MWTGILKCCGAALLCAAASLILSQFDRRGEIGVRAAGVVLLLAAALTMAEPVLAFISECIAGAEELSGTVRTVMTVLGMAAAGKMTADLCRELGAGGVAAALETAVRTAILLSTLPLIRTALGQISALLGEAGI